MKHTASLPCTEYNTYKGVEADLRSGLLRIIDILRENIFQNV